MCEWLPNSLDGRTLVFIGELESHSERQECLF